MTQIYTYTAVDPQLGRRVRIESKQRDARSALAEIQSVLRKDGRRRRRARQLAIPAPHTSLELEVHDLEGDRA
jgi:hypothetical protein